MPITTPRSRVAAAAVAAATIACSVLAASPAQAVRSLFFEQQARAFWSAPHECADGSVVQGTLLVEPTYDYNAPEKVDSDPTTRVQFHADCPGGISFDWITVPFLPGTTTTTIDDELTSMTTSGSATAREPDGTLHQVSFDAAWAGVGGLETTVNGPGSKEKERQATATGTVTFDGAVLVDGAADHPTRPAPFIRQITEK